MLFSLTCFVCSSLLLTSRCLTDTVFLPDTAGQEEHAKLREHYIRQADVVILGFSVTSIGSYLAVEEFLELIHSLDEHPVIIAVGNKIDLVGERQVRTEDARSHFESMNPPIRYIETSAKTGENVRSVFEYAVRDWRAKTLKVNENSSIEERLKTEGSDKKCIQQ